MTDKSTENGNSKERSEEERSGFRLYAYGHAAVDRAKNSRMLKVFLSEMNPTADGEMGFSGSELEGKGKDLNDKDVHTKLRSENSIDCDWIPLSSNRATPPDVVEGEPILIYRFGDDKKYYWSATGFKQEYRKLETVVWTFAANPGGVGKDPKNMYYVEVSTDRKLITLQTSKANGEPFAFTAQVNLEKGTWHVSDDTGNQVEADFSENHFAVQNADGSTIDCTKDHIYAKNKSGSVIDIEADHIYARNVTGTVVDLEGGNAKVNAPTMAEITGGGKGIRCTSAGVQFV